MRFWLCLLIVAASLPLVAQDNPLCAGAKTQYEMGRSNLVKAAEKMPEEKYNFKPVDSVRSFGQLVGHVADAQYLFCAPILGEAAPRPGVEKNKTAKADLVAALGEAFAYCDKAHASLTDAHAADAVKFFGRESTKLGVLNFNNMHNYEHYGNMVTYLRMNNLVPPSSESAPAPKKK